MPHRRRILGTFGAAVAAALALAAGASADVLVSTGSTPSPFIQNAQNEPAVAVDPIHPNVLVAGSNDNIDMESCNAGSDSTCPYSPVGGSGVYFSSDSGASWTQPTYTGYSARSCVGVIGDSDPDCQPVLGGPIGTVPRYDEAHLTSNGDPALAFGPVPDQDGHFSWANGSRLYYANLAAGLQGVDSPFLGFEAVAVSHVDNVAAAASGDASAWSLPVVASKQDGDRFADKPQIWADNAASSPYFGNVYSCYNPYQARSHGLPGPLDALVSRDGGQTWKEHQLTPAPYNEQSQQGLGRYGCNIRTDSHGRVYVFVYRFPAQSTTGVGGEGAIMLITSDDGGATWSRPRDAMVANDLCTAYEISVSRCVIDGVGGSRDDLGPAPGVDIANGAPTGDDATDQVVMAWADGRDGLNGEDVMFSTSTDRGASFTAPRRIQTGEHDRGFYAAAAISPNGTDVYVIYNAFTEPFKTSREGPENDRPLVGVLQHADVSSSHDVGSFTEMERGQPGDARGSSQMNLATEFIGDYVGAIATRTYGGGLWNDVRNAADCPAMDEYVQELHEEAVDLGHAVATSEEPLSAELAEHPNGTDAEADGGSPEAPAPQQECPPTFGNSDIYGSFMADPTP